MRSRQGNRATLREQSTGLNRWLLEAFANLEELAESQICDAGVGDTCLRAFSQVAQEMQA